MDGRLTPYPFQQEIINKVATEPTKSALIAASLGAGKTLIAVEICRMIDVRHPTILVVAPLATRISWERTFKRQGVKIPVVRIDSKVAGKKAMEDLKQGVPGIYLIGREYFRRFKYNSFKKVGVVIVDEIHSVAARGPGAEGTKGFQSLMSLTPEWRIAMSGTPWGNKFENAYFVQQWLWYRPRKGWGFWAWVRKWANQTEIFTGLDQFGKPKFAKKILGEKQPGAFVASLPSYHKPDLPPHPIVLDELYVELTPAQRKMYDHFEEKSYVWLGEKALIEDIPIVERIRLREMALGTVTLDEEDRVIFDSSMKSAKIETLLEYLKTDIPDENVVILTHSKKFAKIVHERVKGSALWDGDTPQEVRERYISEFGVKFQYLVATIPSLREGIDGLQENCNTIVILSRTEDDMMNQQTIGRIARPATGNVIKSVLVVDIIAANTIDEDVRDSLYLTNKVISSTLNRRK